MEDNFDGVRKRRLQDRINASVHRYDSKKRKKRIAYISSIAALLVVGLFSYQYYKLSIDPSLLLQEAASSNALNTADSEVRLILNNEEEITITDKKPDLVYSPNGTNVNINNGRNLIQSSKRVEETSYNTIVVPLGKKSKLTLSDGTKVWVNSGSKLTYPTLFSERKREVFLQGEAIFEVTHNPNNPFHVLVDGNDIKVLGTIFNVSSYTDDDFVSTALQSGSVEITYKNQNKFLAKTRSVKIVPGTLATYYKKEQKINTEKTDMAPYFSWRNGEFIFQNSDLRHIMKKISRHYGVKITISDSELSQKTFSGKLDINTKLDTVMQIMKRTSGFEFEKNGNNINILDSNLESL